MRDQQYHPYICITELAPACAHFRVIRDRGAYGPYPRTYRHEHHAAEDDLLRRSRNHALLSEVTGRATDTQIEEWEAAAGPLPSSASPHYAARLRRWVARLRLTDAWPRCPVCHAVRPLGRRLLCPGCHGPSKPT